MSITTTAAQVAAAVNAKCPDLVVVTNFAGNDGSGVVTAMPVVALASGDANTAALVSIDPAGANNKLTFTAVAKGADGNRIKVLYVDPGDGSPLDVLILDGRTIYIVLGDGGPAVVPDLVVKQLVSQVLKAEDFVDELTTRGHLDFTTGVVPANAIVLAIRMTTTAGFNAEPCTMDIGWVGGIGEWDSGLSGASPFDAAPVQDIQVGGLYPDVSPVDVTPRVQLTAATDFTLIKNDVTPGRMVVTIYYIGSS